MKNKLLQILNIAMWMGAARKLALLLTLVAISAELNAQTPITVSGKVVDDQGRALIGASVIVKGTTNGVSTGTDGSFTIKAPSGAALSVQYVGYVSKEVRAAATLNVTLSEDVAKIDALTVTLPYGSSIKRADVIGSVSSVSAAKIEERTPVSIFDAIQGEMAGVQITSNSGAPGDEMSIRVRGTTSFENAGSSPLYVVDGIIMSSISSINPNDIEFIDVLKDAASAAIYGSRAANGVVMITTKRAKDGKARIEARYVQSYGILSNKIPQANRMETEIMMNTIVGSQGKDQFAWFSNPADSVNILNTTSYDNQELISQMAKRSDFGLSASGGTEKLNYYTGLNYLDDQGTILTSFQKRVNGRLNIDYTPYKWLKLTSNVSFVSDKVRNINEGMTFYQAIRRVPQMAVYFPAGGKYVPAWLSYPNNGKRNPILELYEREDATAKFGGSWVEVAEITLNRDLKFVGRGSASYTYSDRETYASPWTNTAVSDFDSGKDTYSSSKMWTSDLLGEAFLNYNRTFGKSHNLGAMFGSSVQLKESTTDKNGGLYLINKDIRVPQATGTPGVATSEGWANSMASLFGRFEYNYQSRYFISGTMRYDGSSRFGSMNRWGMFPAIQGGWRFTDAIKWDKFNKIVTDGKVRVSWAVVGNDQIGNYDSQTLLTASSGYGYNGITGVIQNPQLGNKYIEWEETTSTNYGLDLAFFDGRFNFVGDYYIKRTDGMLDNEEVPTYQGYSKVRVNVGSVENKGLELTFSGYPIKTKDFSWFTSLNWSKVRNRVIKIASDHGRLATSGGKAFWWVEEGKPAGLFYGFKQNGVYAYDASNAYTPDFKERLLPQFQRDSYGNVMFNSEREPILTGYKRQNGETYTGSIAQMKASGVVAKGGDLIWDDFNRDGDVTDEDKQILGNGYPDWFSGWNNTFTYKNLSLNVSLYWSQGGLIYNSLLWQLSNYGDASSNIDPRAIVQGWRYQGQITDWYKPGNDQRVSKNDRELNDFYLEDGSFLKLNNVRLGYNFNPTLAKKLFVNSIMAYVYGRNLYTWTNYRGYDPELAPGGVLNPGEDNARYPKKREFGFGVTIGF